jgi:hypothetical protein
VRVTLWLMHSHLDGIPPHNVNIPVREFARGWYTAEHLHDDRVVREVSSPELRALSVEPLRGIEPRTYALRVRSASAPPASGVHCSQAA